MAAPDLRAVLDDLWGRLWAGGHADPVIAIEQISYFILLRRLDLTQERLLDGREPAASIFKANPRLRWSTLETLPDGEMIAVLEEDLIPLLGRTSGPAFERAMAGGRLALKDPSLVRACMAAVDYFHLGARDVTHQGEIYEALLEQLQLSGRHGQLRSPASVSRTMVELVEPQPGQTVCDPAAGTGGLLVEAARQIRARGGNPRGEDLRGYDINDGMVRLGAFDLLFHGIDKPAIEQADTLAKDFEQAKYDIVITNPPFGETLSHSGVHQDLSAAGRRTELLFLELCRQLLRQDGKAAVLVPQAVLFGKSSDFISVRQNWLEGGCVHAIVSLPAGILEPYTSVRTAIVFASARGPTKRVWFCQVPDEPERSSDAGVIDSELSGVAAAVRSKLEDRVPDEAAAAALAKDMWSASIEQIENRNWNLLPSLYRPAEALDQDRPEPLEILHRVEIGQAEIGQRLTEARRLLEEM